MDLREKLIEEVTPKNLFNINLFGLKIAVSDAVIVMWMVMAVIILFAVIITRRMKIVPQGRQLLAESIVDFINSMCKNVIGHHWRPFAPFIGTVALFLVLSNIVSIFNILPSGELLYKLTGLKFFEHLPHTLIKPPTKNVNVAVALAVLTMFVVILGGIVIKTPRGWLRSFIEPSPILLPFKILDFVIRPTSLSLRLFGNILGAFIVMELIYFAVPLLLPAALSIYFDLFDGILQAYVFVFLSSFYIAEAVE